MGKLEKGNMSENSKKWHKEIYEFLRTKSENPRTFNEGIKD